MRKCFRQLLRFRSNIIEDIRCLKDYGGCDNCCSIVLLFVYLFMIAVGVILIAEGYLAAGIPLLVPFITFPLASIILYPIFYILFKIVTVPFKALSKFLDKISDDIE